MRRRVGKARRARSRSVARRASVAPTARSSFSTSGVIPKSMPCSRASSATRADDTSPWRYFNTRSFASGLGGPCAATSVARTASKKAPSTKIRIFRNSLFSRCRTLPEQVPVESLFLIDYIIRDVKSPNPQIRTLTRKGSSAQGLLGHFRSLCSLHLGQEFRVLRINFQCLFV